MTQIKKHAGVLALICLFIAGVLLFNLYPGILWPHLVTIENKSGETLHRLIVLFPDGKSSYFTELKNGTSCSSTRRSDLSGVHEVFFSVYHNGNDIWFHKSGFYISPLLSSNYMYTIECGDISQSAFTTYSESPKLPAALVQPISSDANPQVSDAISGENSETEQTDAKKSVDSLDEE